MLIRTKLLISIAIPCVSLFVVGVLKTHASSSKAREMAATINLVELSQAIGNYVHEAQKERGLTAGFLGSNGTRLSDELKAQHDVADAKLVRLREAIESFDHDAHEAISASLSETMGRLDRLESIRSSALQQQIELGDAIGYYTQNHTELLDLIGSMTSVSSSPDNMNRLAAYSVFLKGKERAGIERAVLSAVFGADEFSGTLYNRLIRLAAEQDAYYGEFEVFASDEAIRTLRDAQQASTFAETLAMRETAIAKADEGGFGIEPGVWFAAMTEKINYLKGVEDALAESLISAAARGSAQASRDMFVAISLSVLSLGASAIVGVLVMRSITKPVATFARAAEDLANGEIAESVNVDSKDELGSLATAMNQFFDNLRQTNIEVNEQMTLANDYRAQIEAIGKSQINVELGMDGTVQSVNDNFTRAMGYSRDEVIGKHHRDLVPEDEQSSREYQEFWRSLNRGEFHSGEFRRIGKDGSDVWISAVYAAILGEDGKPYKVVKFALDITQAKKAMDEARTRDAEQTQRLTGLVQEIASGADQIDLGSQQIAGASQSMSEGSATQAANLEQISASLEEMSSMTERNAENCRTATALSGDSRTAAERGQSEMQEMAEAMSQIKTSSDEISKIIKVIDEIAFQTNLLALNAAVEAARAGEAGKGFAVVAEEVRNLAQRSAEAAKNTAAMIAASSQRADNGANIAHRVGEALEEIFDSTQKVHSLVGEIAASSQEQAEGVSQINGGVTELDRVTQQNAARSEELASNAQETAAQVSSLRELVSQVAGNEGRDPSPRPSFQRQQESLSRPVPQKPTQASGASEAHTVIPFDDDDTALASF